MSAKNLDKHGRWRGTTVAFRMSKEENMILNRMVALSGLTKQDYIIRKLTDRDVVVYGNPRVHKALKNEMLLIREELARLSHAGEVSFELQEVIRSVAAVCAGMEHDGK